MTLPQAEEVTDVLHGPDLAAKACSASILTGALSGPNCETREWRGSRALRAAKVQNAYGKGTHT